MDFTLHHAAISAKDMAVSVAFYEQFGFKVVLHWKDPDGAQEIAHLKLGGNYLEIFWFEHQMSAPETAGSLATDLPRIGVKHVALQVNSVHDAKEFVENRGSSHLVGFCSQVITESGCLVDTGSDCFRRPVRVAA